MVQYTLRRTTKAVRFPNEIREYRLKAGLSQKALGALLGKGRSIISAWERGRRLPTLPSVFKLAKHLGTLAESLYKHLYSPENDQTPDGPRP